MNTSQLLSRIEELKYNYTIKSPPFSPPTNLYLDNVNYHKLLYSAKNRDIYDLRCIGAHSGILYLGMKVFKVDVQEDHVNVC